MKKFRFNRIWVSFFVTTLIVNTLVFGVIIGLLLLLLRMGVIPQTIFDSDLALIIAILGSLSTGTAISLIVVHIILQPISKLNTSMRKVVESDFSIQLSEDQPIDEVNELYHSFNLMVRELQHIETLQNDFISSISHEFKTPLTTIQGYAQLLQSSDLSEEKRNEYTTYILTATRRLTNLTGNILKISKLENQGLGVEKEVYRLDEQIREAILDLQFQWEAKNISFNIHLDRLTICANRELLHQVWVNLMSNAIKYNHRDGNIQIEGTQLDDNHIQVSIQDNGIGISPEQQALIFAKFYQADDSRKSQGIGLGLAIVKKITELHEGKIIVESIPNQGTKFTVTFPTNIK